MLETYGKLTAIGLASGLLAGIVGGGSDALIAPALVFTGVLSTFPEAVGTSLATLLPPVGIFAVYQYYKKGNVNLWYAFYIAIMFTIGSYIMSLVGVKLNKNITRRIYAVFLVGLGVFIFVDSLINDYTKS
jgi:uncharacterized membrane protein YfcA